ncbi:hypothetical protein SO694_000741102 [Aureococcus anophagefferens]|uniref:AMP-dependent synthetase/ligase domain-containing protein n=1 Tax=Aureococcus anophagefferens TaxID=44056 RepID=A0ABR1FHJ9_AURAN
MKTTLGKGGELALSAKRRGLDYVDNGDERCVDVRIVDPESRRERPAGEAGEIWISSGSVAKGYWGKEELSEETFHARLDPDNGRRYLRTGDEGFSERGGLFICGRLKDMIIVGGENYYPEDVEIAAQAARPGDVRPACLAAFSADAADGAGDEALVVVFEVRAASDAEDVCRAVARAVAVDVGLAPERVVAIEERSIPKTTSGKIQRRATKKLFAENRLRLARDSAQFRDKTKPLVEFGLRDEPLVAPPGVDREYFARTLAEAIFVDDATALPRPEGFVEDATALVVAALADGATVADISRALQRCYTETLVREASARAVGVAGAEVRASTPLAEQGLTSRGASKMVRVLSSTDNLMDVDAAALMEATPKQLSALVLKAGLGEDAAPTFFVSKARVPDDELPGSALKIPQPAMDLLQGLGVVLVAFCMALPLLPAYAFGFWAQWKRVHEDATDTDLYVRRNNDNPWGRLMLANLHEAWTYGLLVALVVPIYLGGVSVIVVVAKWLVVGKARPGVARAGSAAYLRHWFVDRLFDQWDYWVGAFVKDTLLANGFYRALGADVAWTASSFEDGGRYAGSPAVRVGDAIAPTRPAGKAAVSPKFDGAAEPLLTGKRHRTYGGADDDDAARRRYYRREAGKLLCFVPILYVPFVSSLAASALCFRRVHWWEWPFRYRNLLFWILLYFWGQMTILASLIILKWLLVGRTAAGSPTPRTLGRELRVWYVDVVWHRIVGRFGLLFFGQNSCLPNVILKLLGADVALSACFVQMDVCDASEADLVTVGDHALISVCDLKCAHSRGTYERVVVEAHAQVGFFARLHAGATARARSVVAQQAVLGEDEALGPDALLLAGSVSKLDAGGRARDQRPTYRHYVQPLATRLALLGLLAFGGLAPAYELAVLLFFPSARYYDHDSNYYTSAWKDETKEGAFGNRYALAGLLLVFRAWVFVVLRDFTAVETDNFQIEFEPYQAMNKFLHDLAMRLLRGSRLAPAYLRYVWGADVDLDAVIYNVDFSEPPLLSLGKSCVLDDGVCNHAHVTEQGPRLNRFGRKTIGEGAVLGPHAITWVDDVVPEGVVLGPRSQLFADLRDFAAGTVLYGCPARRVKVAEAHDQAQ